MCIKAYDLEYHNACYCAGAGCGGHLVLDPAFATMIATLRTLACHGQHGPGPCPPSQQPAQVEFGS